VIDQVLADTPIEKVCQAFSAMSAHTDHVGVDLLCEVQDAFLYGLIVV
jgi:hypothetical protein